MVKFRLTIWLAFFSLGLSAQQTGDTLVSVDVKDVSFDHFASLIEQQSKFKVAYKPAWMTTLKVTVNVVNQDPVTLLKTVLPRGQFNVTFWNHYIIILKDENLIEQLPDYNRSTASGNDENQQDSKIKTGFMQGRKADYLKIKIGQSKFEKTGKNVLINGKVTDAITGEPIEYATLYIAALKKGAISDEQGNIELKLPAGKYNARFECLGMKQIDCQIEVMSEGHFQLSMEPKRFDIEEVEVYGDRQMNIREKDPGLEKLNVKAIKELPTMMGESDIIRVSEMLPGVVSVGEGSAGLNIRGGAYDQNAFYFNKIAIYNPSHMFGFFPAFNADVISNFSLYKGYIPAIYGGRLSSVFNIDARTGNKKKYTAHGGISPIAANITAEGPIKRDTASFFVNVRSSYSDWILKQINDYNIQNSQASFYDVTASFDYDLPKTQINVFGYRSRDYFKFSDINTYWYSNSGVSATVRQSFTSRLRADFSASASQYDFKTIDEQFETAEFEHRFKVGQYEFNADFTQVFSSKHALNFGVDGIWYKLNRGKIMPFGSDSNLKPIDLGDEQGLEAAIYVSDQFDLTPRFSVTAGFRFSFYSAYGPEKVYTYFDNGPKELRTVKDSIFFDKGQAVKPYYFPEFRVSLNYQTDENGNIKLSFNQMHQSIFMLNNTITIAPNSQWKLSDYHLKPSRAYQFSAGVFRTSNTHWEFSFEAFLKQAKNYTEFKDGADFIGNPQVETTVLQGDLNSYGIELLLKKYWPKINIWLAYTFSRSFIQVDGEEWEQINRGVKYPSNFDIPHVLNAVFTYHVSKRVAFSTTITYQTGRPATFPTAYYFVEDVPHLDYSKRNEYRIPYYFRTDISLTVEGNLRKKKFLHSTFNFSVYNLTSRDNPYSVFFEKENSRVFGFQYTVIGVPIFMATWIFKLGNYDAN